MFTPRRRFLHITRQPTPLLLLGFVAAVGIRVAAGGPDPAGSLVAGLLFAAVLGTLCLASGDAVPTGGRHVSLWGALGAVVLCAPVLAFGHMTRGNAGFAPWAAAVTVVVIAEEAFLRGALFTAVMRAAGSSAAVLVTAVCFAALHIPLYGWRVVPLDFAVGLLLGALRLASGSWVAPAITHAVADYVGWFSS
jgi:membrane protease YdiL (CAAX protease family)